MISRIALALLALNVTGCASFLPQLLPDRREWVESRFESFDEARAAFDEIVPNVTSTDDLRALGFHPEESPNVEILTYMDVFERFVPNNGIYLRDQDPGVQECIHMRELCHGWQLDPLYRREERIGNLALDFLSFRRQTEITGWNFSSLLIVVDGRVVYKLWDGNPDDLQHEDRIRPLGPLQDFFFVLDLALRVAL
jgi:hypothetical protein